MGRVVGMYLTFQILAILFFTEVLALKFATET
jgi:hypothetical protein